MVIITGYEDDDSPKVKKHEPRVTFYKVICSTCNILKWDPPPIVVAKNSSRVKYTTNRVLSTVGGAVPVTDEGLKKQLLDALMVQTNSAGRLIKSELKIH